MTKKSEINISVELDENLVPEKLSWAASGSENDNGEEIKAAFLSVWDDKDKVAKRVDLWTKDMMVDDMRIFFYQHLVTLSDVFIRSTGEQDKGAELKKFANEWAESMGIIKRS